MKKVFEIYSKKNCVNCDKLTNLLKNILENNKADFVLKTAYLDSDPELLKSIFNDFDNNNHNRPRAVPIVFLKVGEQKYFVEIKNFNSLSADNLISILNGENVDGITLKVFV